MVIPIEILEKTNIKQHQAIIDKVNDIIDVVNDQGLETIKDTVNDVKARVGVLENENDTQDTEISQLGTRVTAVESKNSTQDSQISEVTGRVTTAETKITALENDKADSTDVTAVANRVTAVEQKNTTQDGQISDVTEKVATIETRTDAIEDDVTSIQEAITVIDGDISALQTGKADKTALNSVETDVADLGTRVDGVESDIINLGTRVTAVEGDVEKFNDSGLFLYDWNFEQGPDNVKFRTAYKKLDGSNNQTPISAGPNATNDWYGFVKLGDLVVKNQGSLNAGKALVVGSDGMVAPGDVGGGGGGPIVYGWENPNSFTAFNEQIKTLFRSASSAQSSNLGHFNLRQYLPNSNISQVKRIDLMISAVVSNNALKLTAEFCVIFPYTRSGDDVVSMVDIFFNQNGIDYISLATADRNITFCDSGGFVEKTEWEFISNN